LEGGNLKRLNLPYLEVDQRKFRHMLLKKDTLSVEGHHQNPDPESLKLPPMRHTRPKREENSETLHEVYTLD
jgi:hypothetical protein